MKTFYQTDLHAKHWGRPIICPAVDVYCPKLLIFFIVSCLFLTPNNARCSRSCICACVPRTSRASGVLCLLPVPILHDLQYCMQYNAMFFRYECLNLHSIIKHVDWKCNCVTFYGWYVSRYNRTANGMRYSCQQTYVPLFISEIQNDFNVGNMYLV